MSSSPNKLRVGLIGVGLVGGALLRQLSESALRERICVVALASSKKMLLSSPDSASLGPHSDLAGSASQTDLVVLASHVLQCVKEAGGLGVIVDCTATDSLGPFYPQWMQQGISVVTPNKKAFSGDQALFQKVPFPFPFPFSFLI